MSLTGLILLVLQVSIVLSVLALGLKATLARATYMLRSPRELGRAFLAMNVFMPAIALAMLFLFHLHPAVEIALAALSVSPVPPIFPQGAIQERSKDDYALSLLVSSALLSIAVMPLTMLVFGRVLHLRLQMPASAVIMLDFRTILIPLLAGIAIRGFRPAFADKAARPLGRLASLLLIVSVVPVILGSARGMLSLIGNGTLLALIGFAFVGILLGHFLGGIDPMHRLILALATASRHPGIALAITRRNFPEQRAAIPAIGLYLIIITIITVVLSKRVLARQAAAVEQQKAA